jgi:hypothetical protein
VSKGVKITTVAMRILKMLCVTNEQRQLILCAYLLGEGQFIAFTIEL